jgi:hypothetical protein
VICNDCTPHNGAIRQSLGGDYYTYDGIELCERHAEMERNQTVIEAMILAAEDEPRERRRYALLQAAAMIFSGTYTTDTGHGKTRDEEYCVQEAEMLLAEIENREAEKQT